MEIKKIFKKLIPKKKGIEKVVECQNIELYQYKAYIIRIVDADTVDAEVDVGFGLTMTQRFRLNEYDAPETYRPRNSQEKKHGEEATTRAAELLLNKEVLLKSTKVAGIYGRFGADIWLEDGRKFQTVMIEEGFSKRKNY
jgi:micrococcal nuclease